jgi:uncharacterized protein YecE (DUF72 family)
MGTQENEPAGYSTSALDRWAARLEAWASGAMPEGLDVVDPLAASRLQPGSSAARDVYLYVISGHKARNPAAALALIDRIAGDRPRMTT